MSDPGPRSQPEPAALAVARDALARGPAGLLTDLDGTLAPIVRDPDAVRVEPGADEALAALSSRLAVVGIVSGRAADDVRRIVGLPDLLVIGNHGLEWLEPGVDEPTADPELAGAAAAVARALSELPDEPGVTLEHKGLSATIHFRNASDPEAAAGRVRAALERAAPAGITLRPGRMSLELRPANAGDKGTAVRAVVERHGLRGLVVMGDDVTDLDMFRAAAALRDEGRLRAAILGIAGGREVPAEVHGAADAVLPDPAAAVALLGALAESA
jgi:trehalose 6-phosphate phosphatase